MSIDKTAKTKKERIEEGRTGTIQTLLKPS
jgi:hypothetical protein